MQPTRVTSKTATLIDNIFINDISWHSLGGNVTSSISDHFLQFSQTDIFQSSGYRKKVRYARNYSKFNKREFGEELRNVDWLALIDESSGTEFSYPRFYQRLEDILDYMAHVRKMTQKQIRLEERPWITRGLLV